MPNSGSDPNDGQCNLAGSIDQLADPVSSTSTSGTAQAQLYARSGAPGFLCTERAARDRLKVVKELIGKATPLVDAAQGALRAGATSACEIRDMQRLELWLARLVVEKLELEASLGAAGAPGAP